ncbi:MAG: DMT family transporter [Dehalococcoidia bacterium]|nr:DMT family transporter [Dehalococcoidia bacterium]MSQ35143.1 DMT family transporter [Dehalococcoidia bacterium]
MALGEMAALADAVCWAGVGVTTKRVGSRVRPIHVSAFLTTVSGAALLVIAAAAGQMDDIFRTPAWAFGLFAGGAVAGAAGMLLFFLTMSKGSVSATYTTTSGMYILFSMIGGVVLLGDSAGPWTVAGAAAIIGGLYLLNAQPAAKDAPQAAGDGGAALPKKSRTGVAGSRRVFSLALGMAALTALLWAVDLVASARALKESDLLTNGLVHQAVPAVLFVSFILASPRMRKIDTVKADRVRLALAGVFYICSTLSWNYALANTSAGITALLASTSPVFALILASLLLRERLARPALLGAVLTFAGIAVIVTTR